MLAVAAEVGRAALSAADRPRPDNETLAKAVERVARADRCEAAEADRDRLADALRRCKMRAVDAYSFLRDIENIVEAALSAADRETPA
jgi:SpoVK/Ycf46/Vps4 family AAA+-type ATPase